MTPNFRIFCFAAFVLACIAALTVSTLAQADDEETPQQLSIRCQMEGGCAVFSRHEFMAHVRAAVEHGRKLGREEGDKACLKKSA